jgi:hypothetical protein
MNSRCGVRFVSAFLALSSLGSLACSNDAGPSTKDKNVGNAGSSGASNSQQSGSAGSSGKGGSGGSSNSSSSASGGTSSSTVGSVSSSSSSSDRGGSSSTSSGGASSSSSGGNSKGGTGGNSSSSAGGTISSSSTADAGVPDGPRADATTRDTNTPRDTRTADTPAIVIGDGGVSSKTGDDGCTDVVANLTLQEIAAYQSLKISIMSAGAEVAAASRKNAIVVGRDTVFRVFVNVPTGWAARDLSARLTLTPTGGQPTRYHTKQSVSESSTDAKLSSTFAIYVPASAMTGEMRYSLQVVECSNTSEGAGNAKFPASGDTDLGIKTTGGLKIKIIPIKVGSLAPDTSDSTLATYASVMNAMYPITSVSFTVGDSLTTPSPVDWTAMLEQLRSKRSQDAPAADVYYFGLVKPADTLRAYCQSTCTSGIGYVVTNASQASGRAAVGIAYADKASTFTMAHEVGHNHGRQHSPCVPAGGSISGVDPSYPTANAGLGVWGWDPRTQTLFDPLKSSSTSDKTKYTNTDIMGYCNTQWISDYTYAGITTRLASVNGIKNHSVSAVVSKWRVLLIDDKGPRWGIPFETEVPAEGEPELATVLDAQGTALETIVVYRTEIGDMDASMVWVPAPKPAWYSVKVGNLPLHPFSAPVAVPRP